MSFFKILVHQFNISNTKKDVKKACGQIIVYILSKCILYVPLFLIKCIIIIQTLSIVTI